MGNVVSPQKVWDNLGADILRLWVASTDYRSEMVASDEILKRTSDQYRRIRNTFRFILGNLSDFKDKDKINFQDQVELDKWIINQAKILQKEVLELYEMHLYHKSNNTGNVIIVAIFIEINDALSKSSIYFGLVIMLKVLSVNQLREYLKR